MKIIVVLLIVLALVFCSGCVLDTYPQITADDSDVSTNTVTIDFPYEGRDVTGTVQLKTAPYKGAKISKKTAVLYGNNKDTEWEEKYYDAMIYDKSLDDLYDTMIEFFDSYASARHLDSDEYAEMVTSFVQTIPYRTEESNTRFPIETVVDNYGDCDDKSILLASILSRKGYDVALFNFGNHMTAAINVSGSYRMIETTTYAFIGEEVNLSEFNVETKTPKVYKIGTGTIPYNSGYKVDAVLNVYNKLLSECGDLYSKMNELKKVIENQEAALKNNYDAAEYKKYTKNVNTYNSYVDSYKVKSEALGKISIGKYNLKETYEIVKSMKI